MIELLHYSVLLCQWFCFKIFSLFFVFVLLFQAGESIELKIQIQWPRGVRRYCEDHFQEIKLGSATNDRCECGRYNISNEEEVMCHTCALIKRVCCVCQKPVDTEAEEAAIRDECETYDVPVPDGIFPLDYKWLHRHDRETTQNY